MNILEPTTALLMKYSPTYTCLFQGAQWFLEHGGRDALGGNGKSVIMDAALLMGDDPYRYPDNLPIVNARGGPGGKPSCGSLPDVSKNFPVKYLVTDTGFGTGLDHPAQPRHRLPRHRQLLPGHQGESGTAEDPLPRRSGAGPVAALPRSDRPTAPRSTGRTERRSIRRHRRAATRRHPHPARDSHETKNRPRHSCGWRCSPRCAWSSCSCW